MIESRMQIKCNSCKKMTDEPINPFGKLLICENCYLEKIKGNKKPNGFTIKDLETLFAKKEKTLFEYLENQA